MAGGDGRAGRRVDDDEPLQTRRRETVREGVERGRLGLVHPLGRRGRVEAGGVPEEAPAVRQPDEDDVHAEVEEPVRLGVEEREEPPPQRPGSHDDEVRAQPPHGERLVQRADGLGRVGVGDDGRDRVVAAALGHRADVDVGVGERVEKAPGEPGRPVHPRPDGRHDGAAGLGPHRPHVAALQFAGERFFQKPDRRLGVRLAEGEADAPLGRRLGHEEDGHAGLAQRLEDAPHEVRHLQHRGALDADERGVADGRHGADGRLHVGVRRADLGAGGLGAQRVLDEERDAPLGERSHRARVEHLRAEVGQFGGLLIAQARERERLRHYARVGREHAVDVGPDHALGSVEGAGQDRGRVVGARTPERRRHAVFGGRHEPGDDGDGSVGDLRQRGARQPARRLDVDRRLAEGVVGADEPGRVERDGVVPAGPERGGDERDRRALAG